MPKKSSSKSRAQTNIWSNPKLRLLTCPANRPRFATQCVSGEQPGCSDTQCVADLRMKSFHSPSLLLQSEQSEPTIFSMSRSMHSVMQVFPNRPLLCMYSSILSHKNPAGPLEEPKATSSKILVSSFTHSSASLASSLPSSTTSVNQAKLESLWNRKVKKKFKPVGHQKSCCKQVNEVTAERHLKASWWYLSVYLCICSQECFNDCNFFNKSVYWMS